MKPALARALTLMLFVFGLVLMAALAAVATWGDLEATVFDSSIASQEPWDGLDCPVLMGSKGTVTVTATVENPTARPLSLLVRMRTSHGFVTLMNQEDTRVSLQAGERKQVAWPVQPSDAAFRLFVLVRVHVLPSGPFPYRSASCGIMVLNTPLLSGLPLLIATVALGLLCLGAGMFLWFRQNQPLTDRPLAVFYGMAVQGGAAVLALIVGLAGLWLFGLLLLVFMLLLGVVMVGQALAKSLDVPTGLL